MDADLNALKFTTNVTPCIGLCIGPVHFTRTFFLAADKDLLLRKSDLENAVILFLMLHYIFWLEYPACCTLSIMMLKLQISLLWLISLAYCDASIFCQELLLEYCCMITVSDLCICKTVSADSGLS